jgi:hypothetical protein
METQRNRRPGHHDSMLPGIAKLVHDEVALGGICLHRIQIMVVQVHPRLPLQQAWTQSVPGGSFDSFRLSIIV